MGLHDDIIMGSWYYDHGLMVFVVGADIDERMNVNIATLANV